MRNWDVIYENIEKMGAIREPWGTDDVTLNPAEEPAAIETIAERFDRL